MNFNGKIHAKIIIKSDYVRADGTCALFLQIFLDKWRKRIPLNISVKPEHFDKDRQRIKGKSSQINDSNLIIEKALADLTKIEVNYRLSNTTLTPERLLEDYTNPSSRIDFVAFWKNEMEQQKEVLKASTYKQQLSVLKKVMDYKKEIYFYEITPEFLDKMVAYYKREKKNTDMTITSLVKSFKKYLHIANKKGIVTPLDFSAIKNKQPKSSRTYLSGDEIRKLDTYYRSAFINTSHKNILARFLFSCFTGLRISDIQKLNQDSFLENYILFTAEKTGKIQRIPLSESALQYVDKNDIFHGTFSDAHINRELKFISKVVGITKNVSFHVARHTFATNFLLSGGRVENLQKLLGHSDIKETMTYVHIVESVMDTQIHNMDSILKNG